MSFYPSTRFIALMATIGLLCSSCEQVDPVVDVIKDALNRDVPEEPIKPALPPENIPPPPEPVAMEPVVNKDARVSILGYHDFTESRSSNDMVLNIQDFRDQMQAIRDAELPVISMRQFLDWKQGKERIPERSIMITIDDGWKATHTLAMGVLKEFGYPYTIFLYKNYVGVGGRSLSFDEVRELAASGATICSHSISHNNMSSRSGRSAEAQTLWLRDELEASHRFLVENFGNTGAIEKTFAFPYGIYSDQVLELAREFGYEACFTVNGKKTTWETEDMEIGRYIVHGTTLANFEPALNFGGGTQTTSGRKLMTESKNDEGETEPPVITVMPPADSLVGNRLPLITVSLGELRGIDPGSISMRVTGFGKVPHQFDPIANQIRYQVPQRLRLDACNVQLSFRHAGNPETEIISWEFTIDRLADYLSPETTQPGTAYPLELPEGDKPPVSSASEHFDRSPSI
ncbi:MAG: polysaccharide deacetylase family protein [Verrucomicrobiota bacterium]